jgi:hypothetical protein
MKILHRTFVFHLPQANLDQLCERFGIFQEGLNPSQVSCGLFEHLKVDFVSSTKTTHSGMYNPQRGVTDGVVVYMRQKDFDSFFEAVVSTPPVSTEQAPESLPTLAEACFAHDVVSGTSKPSDLY